MANKIYRGTTEITAPKRGATSIDKVYLGNTKIWENWVYDTTDRYGASASGIYIGLTMYSSQDIAIKNPVIHYNMWACNGSGEVSDGRDFRISAKRVSDGGWDTLWSYYSGWDMEGSCDEINTDVTITNGVLYNQFAYYVGGVGQNHHGGNCYVTSCYHQ